MANVTHYKLAEGNLACGADSKGSRKRCSQDGSQLESSTHPIGVDCARCEKHAEIVAYRSCETSRYAMPPLPQVGSSVTGRYGDCVVTGYSRRFERVDFARVTWANGSTGSIEIDRFIDAGYAR